MPSFAHLILIITINIIIINSRAISFWSSISSSSGSYISDVAIITFSCHHRACKPWLHAQGLKVTFILLIKAAISDWRPVTDVSVPHRGRTPSLCGRSGWQQQHMAPQRLHSISSCVCFVGVSWTAVDLHIFNSWNQNRWRIGYGRIVDSGAVNKWSVAGVSASERAPRAGDTHHTPLIDGNRNPTLTLTLFCCQRREV